MDLLYDPYYNQNQLNRQPNDPGICFRVSYKWTSCKMRGVEFKYMGLNYEKTLGKQQQYLMEPSRVEALNPNNGGGYHNWVQTCHANDEYYIDHWGDKHGGIKCNPLAGNIGAVLRNNGVGQYVVYCYYGTDNAGALWGHAVAFAGLNNGVRFFDPNEGEYEFGANDNVAQEIDQYINDSLANGRQIRNRYTYELFSFEHLYGAI